MKKLILTNILIIASIITASAKSPEKVINAELQGNWKYEVNYVIDSMSCYLKSENYFFYGNNECVVYHNFTNCLTQEELNSTDHLTWRMVDNLILFYNKQNKIVNHILVKNNPNYVLNGNKESSAIKHISSKDVEELYSMVMPN